MPIRINGPAPRPEFVTVVRTSVSPRSGVTSAAASLAPRHLRQGYGFGANRRGIIPHWDVPPPFENRTKALIELGVEQYKDAVRDYYATIRDAGVEQAKYAHARWVVRRCISAFETEMRRFKRHWEYRGHDQNLAANRGLLISPEEMYASARMMVDIEYVIRRWQVAPELRSEVEKALRARLQKLWELKP